LDASILLATFRRAAILRETLAAMSHMVIAGLTWEVVVVDNADDESTRQVCESYGNRIPIRYLVCTNPGKNAALNHGVHLLRGHLVVLTDDDVRPEDGWLREMVGGARRWPEHVLFGGRVLPEWPGEPPALELDGDFGRWTYGICDPAFPEGPCHSFLPLGANMAVRRRVFEEGILFNERIGPNGRSYAMGSETDLILRLREIGHQAVFLPAALVRHVIEIGQLDRSWLIHRAFRQGRGETRLQKDLSWYHVARIAKHATWATAAYYGTALRHGRANAFRKRIACSLTRGRLYEAMHMKLRWSE
jgi:glycosyltransferase involved in cell wall biosynthesis